MIKPKVFGLLSIVSFPDLHANTPTNKKNDLESQSIGLILDWLNDKKCFKKFTTIVKEKNYFKQKEEKN